MASPHVAVSARSCRHRPSSRLQVLPVTGDAALGSPRHQRRYAPAGSRLGGESVVANCCHTLVSAGPSPWQGDPTAPGGSPKVPVSPQAEDQGPSGEGGCLGRRLGEDPRSRRVSSLSPGGRGQTCQAGGLLGPRWPRGPGRCAVLLTARGALAEEKQISDLLPGRDG